LCQPGSSDQLAATQRERGCKIDGPGLDGGAGSGAAPDPAPTTGLCAAAGVLAVTAPGAVEGVTAGTEEGAAAGAGGWAAAVGAVAAGGNGRGALAHAASQPVASNLVAADPAVRSRYHRSSMWIILLEALGALLLLVGIVWWTMFSGRSRGERRHRDDTH